MKEEEYTELELKAKKWLAETDVKQFSTFELLTMFNGHLSMDREQYANQRVIEELEKIYNTKGPHRYTPQIDALRNRIKELKQ